MNDSKSIVVFSTIGEAIFVILILRMIDDARLTRNMFMKDKTMRFVTVYSQ